MYTDITILCELTHRKFEFFSFLRTLTHCQFERSYRQENKTSLEKIGRWRQHLSSQIVALKLSDRPTSHSRDI